MPYEVGLEIIKERFKDHESTGTAGAYCKGGRFCQVIKFSRSSHVTISRNAGKTVDVQTQWKVKLLTELQPKKNSNVLGLNVNRSVIKIRLRVSKAEILSVCASLGYDASRVGSHEIRQSFSRVLRSLERATRGYGENIERAYDSSVLQASAVFGWGKTSQRSERFEEPTPQIENWKLSKLDRSRNHRLGDGTTTTTTTKTNTSSTKCP